MEEQFILRVPNAIAQRLNKALDDEAVAGELELDVEFESDGRTGHFTVGDQEFPASLLDLPCIVESWKTFDDNALVKVADVGQLILVREPSEPAPEGLEHRNGLTPPMRDVRRRRFRRAPDLPQDIVEDVERDLRSIMAGGTARDVDVELVEHEEEAEDDAEEAPAKEGPVVSPPTAAGLKGRQKGRAKQGAAQQVPKTKKTVARKPKALKKKVVRKEPVSGE